MVHYWCSTVVDTVCVCVNPPRWLHALRTYVDDVSSTPSRVSLAYVLLYVVCVRVSIESGYMVTVVVVPVLSYTVVL